MLTVLIRYQKSRIETLTPAHSVEFWPEGTPKAGLLMTHTNGDQSHVGLSEKGDENWRDVFVMNDKGATVARYTL